MVLRSRREYLEAIRLRYHRSSKKDKAVILDEFCSKTPMKGQNWNLIHNFFE